MLGMVSILARPEGRALRGSQVWMSYDNVFQSSPAPKDGRYIRRAIRAAFAFRFQSSPAPKDGRYRWRTRLPSNRWRFQSSPAPKDGRYLAPLGDFGATGVSILARPEGRALPKYSPASATSSMFQSSPAPKDGRYSISAMAMMGRNSFQSSPAPKDGRYFIALHIIEHPAEVSILARPEGRALLVSADLRRMSPCVSILARPEGRALPKPIRPGMARQSFQSSPAPKDGRYAGAERQVPSPQSFNPRPPRRTGATSAVCIEGRVSRVSILARPEGRALQCCCKPMIPRIFFEERREPGKVRRK